MQAHARRCLRLQRKEAGGAEGSDRHDDRAPAERAGEQVEGVEDRPLVLPLGTTGLVLELPAHQVLRDWTLPHFYFHVVTAYDILRHHGVPLGKPDYMNHVSHAIRKSE